MCVNGLALESWPRTDFTGGVQPSGDNGLDGAEYRHLKSLYFTFTSSTTVGFGDFTPKTYRLPLLCLSASFPLDFILAN